MQKNDTFSNLRGAEVSFEVNTATQTMGDPTSDSPALHDESHGERGLFPSGRDVVTGPSMLQHNSAVGSAISMDWSWARLMRQPDYFEVQILPCIRCQQLQGQQSCLHPIDVVLGFADRQHNKPVPVGFHAGHGRTTGGGDVAQRNQPAPITTFKTDSAFRARFGQACPSATIGDRVGCGFVPFSAGQNALSPLTFTGDTSLRSMSPGSPGESMNSECIGSDSDDIVVNMGAAATMGTLFFTVNGRIVHLLERTMPLSRMWPQVALRRGSCVKFTSAALQYSERLVLQSRLHPNEHARDVREFDACLFAFHEAADPSFPLEQMLQCVQNASSKDLMLEFASRLPTLRLLSESRRRKSDGSPRFRGLRERRALTGLLRRLHNVVTSNPESPTFLPVASGLPNASPGLV